MKHLLICREYPPAPIGGIGAYVLNVSRLLAESGETVHVIGQLWKGAEDAREEQCNGKLVIHRVPYRNWKTLFMGRPHSAMPRGISRSLFNTEFPPLSFSWQASLLAERLIMAEGIDLIEAQEYEAPLYYFQMRRALGQCPQQPLPPCLVHLHSPSEFIARFNDWKLDSPAMTIAKRLEEYSIAAADGLLCPSRFLARQAERNYRLAEETIHVIPYPIGEIRQIERDQDTWENGTICYAGRLEPRKGVLEWIPAAVAVARRYPNTRFEFVGRNSLGSNPVNGDDILRRLVPPDLRYRFLLRGEQDKSSLGILLGRARMAVVPSRWENFPNACIEAMASGLPVIATREGGMVEMIRDGHTGWLADEATPKGLSEALVRALETPWDHVARMGQEAARDIHRLCDSGKVLDAQLTLRRRLLERGAGRPKPVPPGLSFSSHRMHKQEWVRNAVYALTHPIKTAIWFLRRERKKRLE
jgi:glycogen synthase